MDVRLSYAGINRFRFKGCLSARPLNRLKTPAGASRTIPSIAWWSGTPSWIHLTLMDSRPDCNFIYAHKTAGYRRKIRCAPVAADHRSTGRLLALPR